MADYPGLPTAWRTTGVQAGGTQAPESLRLNPAGKVPIIDLPDGRVPPESNAIIPFLAEGSPSIPQGRFERAWMLRWASWERHGHDPCIAVRRFRTAYLQRPAEDLDPKLPERGRQALSLLERARQDGPPIACGALTLADVVPVACTRMAGEGGYSPSGYPAATAWIAAVEVQPGIGAYMT